MSNSFLPYGRQDINDEDIQAVVDVLKSNWLTTGPAVEAFESALGDYIQSPHVVACANGTAALHLAAMALELGGGCSVIVPAITFLATASAPHINGAEIVFCDVDPDTGLMTSETLQRAIQEHKGHPLRAVFPVHLAGQPCDMPAIRQIAEIHNLLVIEDACHALGAIYSDSTGQEYSVGSCVHSDLCVYSFHPVKNIATGEGGALSTNDLELATRLSQLRSHAMSRNSSDWQNKELAFSNEGTPNPWYYEINQPSLNYRLSDINAALGTSQLKRVARFLERRRQLVSLYQEAFKNFHEAIQLIPQRSGTSSGLHLFAVLIDFNKAGKSRADVMDNLRENGIGTQVHYIPVSKQPYFHQLYGGANLPGAIAYYERTLSLPLYPGMENSDVYRVVDALKLVL
ncbi:UDP-4-amino-4,6-dideoxy-N-acetyl-beta-L-altrosamine transaminase [Kiloniella majae]|uniref:UDP-4-amino-4, 6-dideoxy-N-acetyl-beta-L-altrosamine transaminase n=1 Tax=Kiloniella majae TaxID=1938558 RepID=UPI000A277417|nr:UDP-4-amino-4,6-dideoxy-N-acetyl-beta-L-altrosamine transaminase [Kiloniella majae]